MTLAQHTLTNFLVEAKCQTYAAQGDDASVPPVLPQTKQLEYRQGNLLYRDIYVGFGYFIGQEMVCQDDVPLWSMGYAGEVIDRAISREEAGRIYGFLQKALRQVTSDRPYRGPKLLQEGEFTYTDHSDGNFDSFWGHEEIMRSGVLVYQLHYHGGVLR